jgi:sugar lactone lactonase YvrE
MKSFRIILLLLLFAYPLVADAQIISTIAGNGSGGDGGPALTASIYDPSSLAFDHAGNLYFSEQLNNTVRKIDAAGIISTIAGTGSAGFSGDDSLAVNAELNEPAGITVDSIGNLFIADAVNNRVRKINAVTGIITTVCGNGTAGFAGDGGLAVDAILKNPNDVKFDRYGNLYISSANDGRIRKINTSGIINTIAGTGVFGDTGDGGLATEAKIEPSYILVDSSLNIYFTDLQNVVIRKIKADGVISRIAGDSSLYNYNGDGIPALSAHIAPQDIAFDNRGLLYFSDILNNRIRMIDSYGIIHTVAGVGIMASSGDGGPADSAAVDRPGPIAFDICGNLYVGQIDDPRIRKITNNTGISAIYLSGDTSVSVGTSVSVIATVTGASTYTIKWYDNRLLVATTTTPFFTYTMVGTADTITATVTSPGGCFDSVTSAAHIVKAANSSVSNMLLANAAVYPNPAHNTITVIANAISACISNAIGQQVLARPVTNNNAVIDISALPPGIYLLTLTALDGSRTVTKIVKQ